jgi:Ca-activated chloride channel family protein
MVEIRLRRGAALALTGVMVAACGGTASAPTGGSAAASAAPEYHSGATPAPWYQEPEPTPIAWPPATYAAPPEQVPTADPYPDVTFDDPGVNPFIDPDVDRESTFALDVDTASWSITKRFLDDGHLPDPASVRPEEFVNAFPMGYPSPAQGTFGIWVDGGPTPYVRDDRYRLVRIGIRSRDVREASRPSAALTFVIDTSGSMAEGRRLEIVKASLGTLVGNLLPDDRVGIVEYGTEARVVLPPTSVRERQAIIDAFSVLHPEGSTNASAGLRLGYRMARDTLLEGGINRVVLLSDGVANVGTTDAEGILHEIAHDARAGINLVTVGVGMGNYNDVLMERLADDGDGFYAYINDPADAEEVFSRDLTGTLLTVAEEARVQVTWDSRLVEKYRLVGFENRAMHDQDFTNDRVDAGEIGAGHAVTALYEVRLAPGLEDADRLGEVRLRWREPVSKDIGELGEPISFGALSPSWETTRVHFRLAATVAAFAEVLRDSPWAADVPMRMVSDEANAISGALDGDRDVTEFASLVDWAGRLGG